MTSHDLEAGIDLFFCSPEHQKLVWFAHKAVCGPGKANPFVWPAFTQAELGLFKANPKAPFPGMSQPFLSWLREDWADSEADALAQLGPLLSDTRTAVGGSQEVQLVVSLSRAFLFGLVRREMSQRPGHVGDASHQSYAVCVTAYDMSLTGTLDATDNEPWRAGLSHRLLVYGANVSHLFFPQEERPPGLEQHIPAIVRNIHDFAAAEIAPTRPDLAGNVVRRFVLPS
ncbi:hypothetical protein JCM10450v2_003482 [Rhodotorula kratochvilovae]